MNYLGLAPKNAESLAQEGQHTRRDLVQSGSSEEAKKLAAAALSAVKDAAAAAAAATAKGKVEVSALLITGTGPSSAFNSLLIGCLS